MLDKDKVILWLDTCAKYNLEDAAKLPWYKFKAKFRLRSIARIQKVQSNIISSGAFDVQSKN